MNNQSSFDRTLWIPIGVAVFALVGLCIVLFAGRITALRGTVEELPSATPFQYVLIGTEPAVSTVTIEVSQEVVLPTTLPEVPTEPPLQIATDTPFFLPTNTSPAIITLPPLVDTNTPTRTATSASTAPFNAGTYDNVDAHMTYNGDWTREAGVSGAYQNTLSVSGTLGNSVSFRFIGNELRVFFQAGPSLGTIRLTLDGSVYDMSQASANTQTFEWALPSVTTGTHTVSISHLSGGSVNIDYIIVPEVPTTPTNTATPTLQ